MEKKSKKIQSKTSKMKIQKDKIQSKFQLKIRAIKRVLDPVFKITFICGVIGSVAVFAFLFHLYKEVKGDIEKVVIYNPPIATQIFDRNNRLVANIFEEEFRFYADFEEIPARVIETLVAVEDTLFFEHSGINLDAIARAAIKNFQNARYAEGGSTITQQLIKNVALSREKTITRKLKEMLLALQVELVLSKEEILERYLNHTYFGHGFYGVKTAARGYFRKELNELSLKESAILMSLPRAPSFYDPTKNYDFSLGRANNVITRMLELGWVSEEEANNAIAELPVVYEQTLTQNSAPYVVDEVLRQLKDIKDLRRGGYKIYVNVDLDYQALAEDALLFGYEQILSRHRQDEELPNALNGAMVVMENNGKIRALIGGVDYARSNFNRATQAKRQIGSTVKPFIFQTALNAGFSQNHEIPDIARTYTYRVGNETKTWQPKNYGNNVRGQVSLRTALAKSLNLATINLVEVIGFDSVHRSLNKYGFSNVPSDLSVSLGSFVASPLEVSRSFSAFSNYGKMVEPQLISSIVSRDGEVANFEIKSKEIMSEEQAFLMVDLLRNAVQSGTGTKAKVNEIELGGKTGTTNDNVDAWFSGFSPSVQVVIWYGKDDNTPIGVSETGGVAPAPVFSYFFSRLLNLEPGLSRNFSVPENVYSRIIGEEVMFFTDQSPVNTNNIEQKAEGESGIIF